ncbi:hypothetical protein [Streptomyces sp. NPDC086023]|uniref:hypothetical protein n=1 Tax=Streptomyces sp. NPDC086023 TaxID=3365746 RepID=UPI0037D7F02C
MISSFLPYRAVLIHFPSARTVENTRHRRCVGLDACTMPTECGNGYLQIGEFLITEDWVCPPHRNAVTKKWLALVHGDPLKDRLLQNLPQGGSVHLVPLMAAFTPTFFSSAFTLRW